MGALISAAIKKRNERLSILNGDTVINDLNDTQVVPVEIKTVEEGEDDAQTLDQHAQFNNFLFTTERAAIERQVADIHEEHRKSQINLDVNIQMKARKQRRKTQLRLKARAKLKKQKVLTSIEAFATLNEDEIEAMLDVMTRELYTMGQTLCKQGDVADKFYVVMKGECTAYGAKNGEE